MWDLIVSVPDHCLSFYFDPRACGPCALVSFWPLHKELEIFQTQNIVWLEVPLPHTEYSVTWFHSSASTQWMCCDFKYRSSDSAPGIFFTGGDGRWLLTGAYNLVQNSGKKTLFPQNWSDNDAKKYRLQDFYDMFDLYVWETIWPKQVQQISWNALLKYILELVACDIRHADKYWIIGQEVTVLTVYTMFLEKYPFVYLMDQAIIIGAWGRCNCKLSYEKKIMPHGKKTIKKLPHGWQQEKKKKKKKT